jgi:hypothetical protein
VFLYIGADWIVDTSNNLWKTFAYCALKESLKGACAYGTNISLIATENDLDTRWNTFRFKRILTGVSCANICVYKLAHTHTSHIHDVRTDPSEIHFHPLSVQFMKSETSLLDFILGPC